MAQISLYRPRSADPWGSFDQLRREMDDVLQRFAAPSRFAASHGRGIFPAVNLYETRDSYVLTAEIPGVAPGDLHVSLEGSKLMLEGERKLDYFEQDGVTRHRAERQAGGFRRGFELPAPIDGDRVEAVHKNGVLTLVLPKTPEAQQRQIAVQAG